MYKYINWAKAHMVHGAAGFVVIEGVLHAAAFIVAGIAAFQGGMVGLAFGLLLLALLEVAVFGFVALKAIETS